MQSPARSWSGLTRVGRDEAVGDGVLDPVLGAPVVDDDPDPRDVADRTGGTRWPVPLTVLVHPASSAPPISAANNLCIRAPPEPRHDICTPSTTRWHL